MADNLNVLDRESRYHWMPSDHNYLAWAFDPILAPGGSTGGAVGTLNGVRIHLPVAATVTNVVMHVVTIGNTLTTGQCFAALYSAAGGKLDTTADQATSWAGSTGLKTMALGAGATVRAAGDYYVVWWANGSTAPAMARVPAVASTLANAGLSAPNLRFFLADTGVTTAGPPNLGAQTVTGNCWWAALS